MPRPPPRLLTRLRLSCHVQVEDDVCDAARIPPPIQIAPQGAHGQGKAKDLAVKAVVAVAPHLLCCQGVQDLGGNARSAPRARFGDVLGSAHVEK